MMKLKAVIIASFIASAPFVSGQSVGDRAGFEIDRLVGRLVAAEEAVAAMQAQIEDLQARAHDAPDLDGIQSQIDALAIQLSALEAKADDYEARIAALEAGTPPGPVCGDGVMDDGEACDDGNLLNGDGCSSVCTVETPPPGGGNFEARRSAPGVVFADPLDTEGPYDGNGNVLLNDNGTHGIPTQTWWRHWRGVQCTNCTLPALDETLKASGTGSLHFVYPSNSSSGGGGIFATNLSPDYSVQFGEGETFYVQYRWRANCDFIYLDCDPTSPTYKTTRRAYAALGGGKTNAKLSVFATGDNDPHGPLGSTEWSQGTCTWLELVTVHGSDHALTGYHSCGWYAGFEMRNGSVFGQVNWNSQPGGVYECNSFPDKTQNVWRSWGNTGPNCFYLEPDEWITVQWRVSIGQWQPTPTGDPLSHVTVWVAHEGEPQRILVDRDLYIRGPERPGERYGKVWLLPFMTSKDPAEAHPAAHIWYDELIVSTQFIGDPK